MQKITVTGLDEKTDISKIKAAKDRFGSMVEFGFLYTVTPEGRNRYPRREWISESIKEIDGQCAVHICGGAARQQLIDGKLGDLTSLADRIQVNGTLSLDEVVACANESKMLITQHNRLNKGLLDVEGIRHAVLVDASGGNGILPDKWRRPETKKPVGFAGGLGPHNLAMQLQLIREVAVGDWWVDMEGRLRIDDWFDADSAIEAFMLFEAFCKGRCNPI